MRGVGARGRWRDPGGGTYGGGARHRRTPMAAAATAGTREQGGCVAGAAHDGVAPCTAPRFRQMKGQPRANVSVRAGRAGVRSRLPPARVQRACASAASRGRKRLPPRPACGAPRWRGRQAGEGRETTPPPRGRAPAAGIGSPASASPAPGARQQPRSTIRAGNRRHLSLPPLQRPRKPQPSPPLASRNARGARRGSTGLPAREAHAARMDGECPAPCVVDGGFTPARAASSADRRPLYASG